MSLRNQSYCLVVLTILIVSGSYAQLFTDQGVFSGSGLTVLPTATVVPMSEFRVQYTRSNNFNSAGFGANIIGFSCGLSTSLEGYARVSDEQVGKVASQVAFGFGGKFRFPMMIPTIRRLAIWGEATSSEMDPATTIYPSDVVRGGILATFDSNGIHPTLLLGISRMEGKTLPLIGAGVTYAVSNETQLGLELMHGYLKKNSFQAVLSASTRLFPNISIQIAPGFVSTSTISTWMISAGISCSTADIDFHPVTEQVVIEEYQLPSIEDLEKQSSQENQRD
ncbi:MAG: hypothetical protein HY960_06420 [Ignavibacteriae bacterium]|nr:hypothetical protein [Ignavibacteriota bacterium]